MTNGPLPPPGRVGVLITGFYYQWLHAWQSCILMLREQALAVANPIIAVEVEVDGAGNLDDLLLRRMLPPHVYRQIKYAVDSTSPVNFAYLTAPSSSGGPSILRKVGKGYTQLSAVGDAVELSITTNRSPDQTDLLVGVRDARTKLLLPRAGKNTTKLRAARAAWAREAGLTDQELLELLAALRFDLARDLPDVEDYTSLLMQVAGLRCDQKAVRAGADWIAEQVRDGRRSFDLEMVQEALKTLDLKQGPVRAVLSIATLKPDPLVDQAVHQLEWFPRLDGPDAFTKRRPAAPATWAQLQADLEDIPRHLGLAKQIAVTGSLRQATAFTLGASLRMVTGIDLAVTQRDQMWATTEPYRVPIVPGMTEHDLDQGPDIAIAVEAATDITEDVLAHVRDHNLPVAKLVVLRPPAGPQDGAIVDAAFANAFAVGIRDRARRAGRWHTRIHLFLAGPMGLAMMLGHRWNRVAPTIVYEEVRAADSQYEAAFTISA